MKTVIMAGGRGTRIAELFPNIPKPLIPIEGIPVLERELLSLKEQGFNEFIITISHMGDKIIEHFGNGDRLGVKIDYYYEKEPLGNAGALYKIKDKLSDTFLLLNADSVFDVDFNRMVEFHKKHNGSVTLFTHPNSHPYDSGLLLSDKNNQAQQWLTKEDKRPRYYKNRVNAGLHVVDKQALDVLNIDPETIGNTNLNGDIVKVDLDRDILRPLVKNHSVYCYDSPEYVKDMGTPDRYQSVIEDFRRGIVTLKNLKNKQKAIFLDRDGVINKYVGFLTNIDDFKLNNGVSDAIKIINQSGYLAIVISNQPVIARGELTENQLAEIHNKMETLLGNAGAYLDAIYYCPHHPDKGYEGEVAELKIECNCRKPKIGLFEKAAEEYNIDLSKSYMVGDDKRDIDAGINANCKTVLIGNDNFNQDISAKSLYDFVSQHLSY